MCSRYNVLSTSNKINVDVDFGLEEDVDGGDDDDDVSEPAVVSATIDNSIIVMANCATDGRLLLRKPCKSIIVSISTTLRRQRQQTKNLSNKQLYVVVEVPEGDLNEPDYGIKMIVGDGCTFVLYGNEQKISCKKLNRAQRQ